MTTSRTVLVVDSDRTILQCMCNALALKGGYAVVPAGNGPDGRQRYLENAPDIVVRDALLAEERDPRTFLKWLREEQGDVETRVVLVSTWGEPDYIRTMFTAGADAYLFHPFSILELVPTVEELLLTTHQERLDALSIDGLVQDALTRHEKHLTG